VSAEPLAPVAPLNERHRTSKFDCGVRQLNEWLDRSARVAAAAGTAATYVLCRGNLVIGYYALAMGSVAHQHAPSRLRRGMPDPVPVVLLARLALDEAEHGTSLGGYLLVDALRRCVRGGREFGARAVVLDAISDDAIGFYRHFGFHELESRRLWRRLTDIDRAVND
jgi:GNAT superfamily N-acetyltransferase